MIHLKLVSITPNARTRSLWRLTILSETQGVVLSLRLYGPDDPLLLMVCITGYHRCVKSLASPNRSSSLHSPGSLKHS